MRETIETPLRVTLMRLCTLHPIIRCRGVAANYLVSIYSQQGCLDACNRDERCGHYSYHKSEASHPDHNNCYIFSSEECDMDNLMYDDNTQWRTGSRTAVSHNHNYRVNISWQNLSGDSDIILSFPRKF